MAEIYYKDGKLKYHGDVVEGEPHGQGVGYWEDGKPMEKGKFYYRSGQLRYEGEFDRDLQYMGQGTEYYENGNMRFTGTYRKSPHLFQITFDVAEEDQETLYQWTKEICEYRLHRYFERRDQREEIK